MSVLIPISMPENCHECPCFDCDNYICQATNKEPIENAHDWRPSDCPLIEVKDYEPYVPDPRPIKGYDMDRGVLDVETGIFYPEERK